MKKEIIERLINDYEAYVEREKRYFKSYWENIGGNLDVVFHQHWHMTLAVKEYLQNLLEDISKGE